MPTKYTNLYDITLLQQEIMKYIDNWCHEEKTPIPHRKVLDGMFEKGKKKCTVINALSGLLKLGYIRRASTISNKTFYVMLRRL